MNFFQKPVEAKTVPRKGPGDLLHAAQVRLASAKLHLDAAQKSLQNYRASHKDLRTAHFDHNPAICLNALQMHPDLRTLEHQLRQKMQKFNAAASEFAEAKKTAGLGHF